METKVNPKIKIGKYILRGKYFHRLLDVTKIMKETMEVRFYVNHRDHGENYFDFTHSNARYSIEKFVADIQHRDYNVVNAEFIPYKVNPITGEFCKDMENTDLNFEISHFNNQ